MNFRIAFEKGQKGNNKGLPMGEGLKTLEIAIGGVKRAMIYSMAAGPKVGKTTIVDVGWVIEPAVFVLTHNNKIRNTLISITNSLTNVVDPKTREQLNIEYEKWVSQLIDLEFVYFSFEIDRVTKEFDFVAHFLNKIYNIFEISLPQGKTHKEKNVVPLSSDFLKGELVYDTANADDPKEVIRVGPELLEKIKTVYTNWIIPLFGEYNDRGIQISKGLIKFIEKKDTPTGMQNTLLRYANENGSFLYDEANNLTGYKPNNPNKYIIVVTDHLRKIVWETGLRTKETVDKFSGIAVDFRNICSFTFVHVIHLNRAMANVERRQYDDDRIFPTAEDIKDTGNLSEDSNYVFTMFNPNDDKYNLKKHFGKPIKNTSGGILYPNMRTLHLVESRNCYFPQHFRFTMLGNVKKFNPLII